MASGEWAVGNGEWGSGERGSGERGSGERGSGERGSGERGSGERGNSERGNSEVAGVASLAHVRPVTLQGRVVVLEPMAEHHAAELFAIGREEQIWTYMARGPLTSGADALELVRAALREQAHGRELPFVIRLRSTGMLVGSSRFLDIQPRHNSVEIGWTFLHPARWATFAAVEAEYLLVAHALEVLGAGRVWFKTDGRNLRAQRALERWGVVREGVLRRHLRVRDGVIRDSVIYSILPEEWPALRRQVAAALIALEAGG